MICNVDIPVGDFTAFPDIPAVRQGRIHLMDGKLFCWYGPRLAEALRVLPGVFERAQVVIDTEEDNG